MLVLLLSLRPQRTVKGGSLAGAVRVQRNEESFANVGAVNCRLVTPAKAERGPHLWQVRGLARGFCSYSLSFCHQLPTLIEQLPKVSISVP